MRDRAEPPTPPRPRAGFYLFRKAGREFLWDGCLDLGAALTYHAVLSVFPAMLALVGLLGVVGQARSTTDALLELLRTVAPANAVALLREPLETLVDSRAAGVALVVGILLALWSASGYVRAFSRSMNRIYRIQEGRPFWKLASVMLLVTLVLLVVIAASGILLVVSGPLAEGIGARIGLGPLALTAWNVIRWPLLVVLAVLLLGLLYRVTPNVAAPRLGLGGGAAIALVAMALASIGLAFYATNFSHYNKTYGAIGGVIILLIWIWILNLAILFGAEFDSERERIRQLRAGLPAEQSLQLVPRDTRQIIARQRQEIRDIAYGRSVRERVAAPSDGEDPDSSGQ